MAIRMMTGGTPMTQETENMYSKNVCIYRFVSMCSIYIAYTV